MTNSGNRPIVRTIELDKTPQGYWTPERIAEVEPISILAEPDDFGGVAMASDATFQGSQPIIIPGSNNGEPLIPVAPTGGDTRRVTDTTILPYNAAGKLIAGFTYKGKPHWNYGSAAIVNERGICTAAHCVDFGPEKVINSVDFIPGYAEHDPNRIPYGIWSVRKLSIPERWFEHNPEDSDFAFGEVTANAGGQDIGDAVGFWLGILAGLDYRVTDEWNNCGYPIDPPKLDGGTMYSCVGRIRSIKDGVVFKWGDLIEGSSGGPWIFNYKNQWLTNGVLSRFHGADTNSSPYFGKAVVDSYHEAFPPDPEA
jgi:V8-like Glu-specific endopeptidase